MPFYSSRGSDIAVRGLLERDASSAFIQIFRTEHEQLIHDCALLGELLAILVFEGRPSLAQLKPIRAIGSGDSSQEVSSHHFLISAIRAKVVNCL